MGKKNNQKGILPKKTQRKKPGNEYERYIHGRANLVIKKHENMLKVTDRQRHLN